MSIFLKNNLSKSFCKILNIYDKVMVLKIFIDDNNYELKKMYLAAANNHNNKILDNSNMIDAGFDLYAPEDHEYVDFNKIDYMTSLVKKIDYGICCAAQMVTDTNKMFNTGYYMYPRSSLSKTTLRLANSTGIIDAGYRGHLIGAFDVIKVNNINNYNKGDYEGKQFDRYLQICAPGLVPIWVEIVDNKEELGDPTERGDGGFGSTGR